MSPAILSPEACAAAHAVLETPLFEVIRTVTSLPNPTKETQAQARFVGGTLGKPQKVVTLNHNDTLSDACEKLARHRILGAPVLIQPDPLHADEMSHDVHYDDSVGRERPVLLGFFDVGDALRALVHALPEGDRVVADQVDPAVPRGVPTVPKARRHVLSWMRVLDTVERKVSNARLISFLGDDSELLYRADANSEGHTFGQTIRDGFLEKRSANGAVHRIAVFDATGEIERIFSMSDAVRYIAANVDRLRGMADLSLKDLGLARLEARGDEKKKLVVIPPATPAIEAFARMCEERVSGVGVLDDRGALIANLSVSDVRCIQPEHFGVLGLPAAELLALLHGTSYAGFSGVGTPAPANPFFAKMNEGGFRKTGPFLVKTTPEASFRDVLRVITQHGVHRVYVCEEGEKPVDVITLTDILSKVCEAAEKAKRA
jgi:5'-AMP-activated protein kinase regulatory gamma subunit